MKYNGLLKFGMVWVLIFLLTAVSFVQPVSLEISAEKVSEIGFPQDASKGFDDSYYLQEAEDIAFKTIRLFGEDLLRTSELHEYYHPDTGEGVNNPGFLNWNLLINNIIAELEGRDTVIEF